MKALVVAALVSAAVNGATLWGLGWMNHVASEEDDATPAMKIVTFETQPDRRNIMQQPSLPSLASIRPPPSPPMKQAPPTATIDLDAAQVDMPEGFDVVFHQDAVDQPARFVSGPNPVYPRAARAARQEGVVELRLLVNDGGRVERVEVLKSTPPGVFDSAATSAAKRYRFEPAQHAGRNVSVWATKRMIFKVRP